MIMTTTTETPEQEAMRLAELAKLTLTDPRQALDQLQAMKFPMHHSRLWDALQAACLWNLQKRKGGVPG
jgi:hypothetical protein